MIRFTTKNSKYEVTVQHNEFHVKKFEAINPESRPIDIVVGQTVVSDYLDLQVGTFARFGGMRTEIVTRIEDI